ncbi:SLIT-ROBO Rho GTPase-activating protein 2 [Ataeniobius toweri]|uniref:SLIT-ROBO Rho GTPase-activating protein 2 n=1 Tax=Ataeniobius toweri TaxID=208326 RepID=A0ABU7AGK3_9TELE|nr:SLIT-ROBO Rho GTPase-activating protein 2 [Ataeniobius toweri]
MEAKTVRFLYSQRCKEVRAQLVEQLKCLDQQCELRVQLLQDLQDFFRKKAEIEMDYSRNLEKLAERFLTKTRSTKDHLLKGAFRSGAARCEGHGGRGAEGVPSEAGAKREGTS